MCSSRHVYLPGKGPESVGEDCWTDLSGSGGEFVEKGAATEYGPKKRAGGSLGRISKKEKGREKRASERTGKPDVSCAWKWFKASHRKTWEETEGRRRKPGKICVFMPAVEQQLHGQQRDRSGNERFLPLSGWGKKPGLLEPVGSLWGNRGGHGAGEKAFAEELYQAGGIWAFLHKEEAVRW